jgi:hypothetical protein
MSPHRWVPGSLFALTAAGCGGLPSRKSLAPAELTDSAAPIVEVVGTSSGAASTADLSGVRLDMRGLRDADGDGYPLLRDCMDADPTVHPGAFEYAGDGVLNDCGEWAIAGPEEPTLVLTAWDAWFNFSIAQNMDVYFRRPFPVGDINGDGVEDLAIGSGDRVQDWPQLADSGMDGYRDVGGVLILYGPLTPQPDPTALRDRSDFTGIAGSTMGPAAGNAVVGVDDWNGDGLRDLLISVTGDSRPSQIWFAAGPGDQLRVDDGVLLYEAEAVGSCLGCAAFETAGDLDGDGRADVLSAAFEESAVYLWTEIPDLSASGTWSPSAIIRDNHPPPAPRNSGFGFDMDASADIDGDGLADLVAGAPRHVTSVDSSAATFTGGLGLVFLGPLQGELLLEDADIRVEAEASEAEGSALHIGYAVAVGDGNGDGQSDLAFGAPYHDAGGLGEEGWVLIFDSFTPGRLLQSDATAEIVGAYGLDLAGSKLGWGSDFDGDGTKDIITGSAISDIEGPQTGGWSATGEMTLFLGPFAGVRTTNRADVVFRVEPRERTGTIIYDTVDWTGDGSPDLLLGADSEWFGIFENPYR